MGTHYKGSKKEVNALNVYIKLIRVVESINSLLYVSLSKEGLTESQFGVLEALFHLGPMSQKNLGDKLLKSGGNITLVIDNLEEGGLVIRRRGVIDRRYFNIHLTEKGKKLIESVFPKQLKIISDEIGILNENDQRELQRMCKLIGLKQ
jgi:MarR family transcriptional regulator, 2-MHQ and catechol-resistance regulon repressor